MPIVMISDITVPWTHFFLSCEQNILHPKKVYYCEIFGWGTH